MNQKKQLKDYPIHLYLGCEVIIVNDISEDEDGVSDGSPKVGSIGRLSLINEGGFTIQCSNDSEEWAYGIKFENSHIALWDSENFKLLLRPLSDMQEWEMHKYDLCKIRDLVPDSKTEVFKYGKEYEVEYGWHFLSFNEMAEITNTMRSLGFDIDGLIEAGLAIDAINNSISRSIK